MDETSRLVIATAMRDMIAKGYVNICTVDECLKVAGVIANAHAMKLLRPLHCVKFAEMPRELVEKIPTLLSQAFDGINIEDLIRAAQPALNNGARALQRLQ